jgi:hypothetical protein
LSLVGNQDSYAVAQGDIALGLIGIYKALGGGWQIRCDGDGMIVAAAEVPTEAATGDDSMLPEPPPLEPINENPTDAKPSDGVPSDAAPKAADVSSNSVDRGDQFLIRDFLSQKLSQ